MEHCKYGAHELLWNGCFTPRQLSLSNRQVRWSGCGWQVIDELKQQNSSFFALRGDSWQILGLDTAIMDNFNLAFAFKGKNAMPFLPDDQIEWALRQIEVSTSTAPCTVRTPPRLIFMSGSFYHHGSLYRTWLLWTSLLWVAVYKSPLCMWQYGKQNGLKTVVMSHHQFFSRTESLGVPNAAAFEVHQILNTCAPLLCVALLLSASRADVVLRSMPHASHESMWEQLNVNCCLCCLLYGTISMMNRQL